MQPNTHTLNSGAAPCGTSYNRPRAEAKRLGISLRQLSNWMSRGVVPYAKIGRAILLDPVKVDAALSKFERREVTR
jgi:hypothetical protein